MVTKADPQSNRSKKRAARGFKGSRPNRRAERRLAERVSGFEKTINGSKANEQAFTKPGSLQRW